MTTTPRSRQTQQPAQPPQSPQTPETPETPPSAASSAPTDVLPAVGDDRGMDPVDTATPRAAASDGAAPGDTPARGVGAVLLVGGLVGAVVALVLLLDKLALLADPAFVPSCSIDPVLSCGTIMRTEQASVLGFPNPVIGLLTYPVAAAMGALVLARVALPRWAWWGLQAGTTAGMLFVHWLIVQSLVVIGALCPWCMVAWVVTIAMFWATTVHNLREGHLGGAPAAVRHHGWGLAAWYLAIVVAVVATFPAWAAGLVGLA
ncbi:vitamin K epoxide reductase family protein [Actinomycetospora cinnamomea]|uniref:vitamin K epoxide reductase family protein n=1 Tax=Actinomycetospora cinnamomea TaxID=663609 RepID=UPI001FAEBB49|nr:vitamin K epoxide reductase family protein [Actinomycetospora cinnamomea]